MIDIIHFSTTNEDYNPPVSKKIEIKYNMLDREKQEIPLLNTKGVLISLSKEQVEIDPDTLKNAMFTEEVKEDIKDSARKNRVEEIDLHIEALRDEISGLEDDEILQIQLSHFEESLDRAVISGLNQITFIHGIGNGTLRNKIHKKLSQYPHIKYFEDAMKEKFGYGATKVHLK
jgi:dsDNA-specific endonuclease/ATPase MutS2